MKKKRFQIATLGCRTNQYESAAYRSQLKDVGYSEAGAGEETLDVIREVRFAKVHMFPYSIRPKTRAARFTDQIETSIKEERRQAVLYLSKQVAFELREESVGMEMKVLLASKREDGLFSGHTENFLEVIVRGESLRSNDIVTVALEANSPEGLVSELLAEVTV